MNGRYEITGTGTTVEITDPFGCVLTLYDGAHPTMTGAIRQLRADLAAVTAERDAWRRRAEESEPHLTVGAKQPCEIDDNPGVQGLAQLGRNAIERVTQLESENAYLRSANSDGAEILQSLRAERDQLRAQLGEIEMAPTVAIVNGKKLIYDGSLKNGAELIARPKVQK